MTYAKALLAGLTALIIMTALIVGLAPLVIGMKQSATGSAGWNFVHIPILPIMTGELLISAAISWAVLKRASKR
jgi:hypothetical protein